MENQNDKTSEQNGATGGNSEKRCDQETTNQPTDTTPPRTDKPPPREENPMMFAFDASPQESPRDGPSHQTPTKSGASESPTASPRAKKPFPGPDFLTQSSPPRFVSLDEIMKAADGVTNMSLAHEIAVDNDFRFQKAETPANSLESQVREVMHRAFWDALEEKLADDPPDYSNAMVLLEEVRQIVLDLLLPQHQRLVAQIEEVLDMDLIRQKAEHEALDFRYYADFVISIMARLCAPVRDDQVAELKQINDVVPLFKQIFAVLDVMKVDMANFTIQQIRPYIQQQSIEYEKSKFKQILKQQEENNLDGLQFTKGWLFRAGEKVCQQAAALRVAQGLPPTSQPTHNSPSDQASSDQAAPNPAPLVSPPGVSPVAILNTAYLHLLQWDNHDVYPETLLLDESRFADLCEKVSWLGLVSSVLMVTYNTVGDPVAGVRTFKVKLKDNVAAIIKDTPFSDVSEIMPTVSEYVIKEVQSCLSEHGYPPLVADRVAMLRGLIESVAKQDQPVHKCLRERLLKHLQSLLAQPGAQNIQVPPGFAAMAEEFSHVYGQFLRLVSHNRAVFGAYYADIIGSFFRMKADQGAS